MKNKRKNNTKIFSQSDFVKKGWHDCKIHAVSFNTNEFKLLFDIDYILEWVNQENSNNYKFKVSPATLIFENVWDLTFSAEYDLNLRIENIDKRNPHKPKNNDLKEKHEFDWTIELGNGEISFKSIGFKQYLRGEIIETEHQELNVNNRGGISFDLF